MPTAEYTTEEVCRLGQEIYERHLRTQLETTVNNGKILVIDVKSGQYDIGEDIVSVTKQLQSRLPNSVRYIMRIGYPGIYQVGGAWKRVSQP